MFFNRRTILPRRVLGLIALTSVLLLVFGLYLQHVVGLEPCPMCIVQRYALVLVAVMATLTSGSRLGAAPVGRFPFTPPSVNLTLALATVVEGVVIIKTVVGGL